eukprot:GFUD01024970.1.p1 GENE.GFUD01024970.1~~GFUD01024970.1.p1  ORF type:complete len:449 (+),score=165.34 GFUD01024970.1:71-1417(+)
MEQSDSEEEMEELTPHQMDLLVQLQDLTGLEDLEVCRALLESRQWDLETVAREQLGMLAPQAEPDNNQDDIHDIPAPAVAPVHPVWSLPRTSLGWVLYMVSLPARLFAGGMGAVWAFVTSLVGLPPRPTSQVADPRGDVAAFCREWEETFGTEHPTFNRGSYSQVLEEAKRELKFLLVYLHCEDHQDTGRFCREVLSNPLVMDQVAASNIIFWGCSVSRPEGYRVSQALRENTYPFMAMIVLRQNRMVVVGRREGMVQADAMVQWIQDTVTDYEAFIVAARAERDERNLDREIRSEQEAAFADTLRRDQEREQRVREKEEVDRKEEEERERLRREELDRKDQIVRLKVELAGEIPEEPELGGEDTVRVVIKLPGGQRLERRFLLSHSLKHIYYFVFCHPDSPDQFDIVTNFPRRTLPCKPGPATPAPPSLKEAGFGKSEMLFVADLDS